MKIDYSRITQDEIFHTVLTALYVIGSVAVILASYMGNHAKPIWFTIMFTVYPIIVVWVWLVSMIDRKIIIFNKSK